MEQIRTLLWLKGRLTLARYRRKRGAFPPILSLLLALPFGSAVSVGLYFAGLVVFWSFPPENARQLLNGALTALYAAWLLGPLLGVSLNESVDLSKLLHFPVPPRRLFLANILGAFMDPSVLFLLPPLAAIPIGLAHGVGSGLLMAFVALLFVFHTLSLSQAMLTLLWGLMRSRRVRDFWKVAAGLAGTTFWITYQFAIHRLGRVMPALVLAKPSRYTRFLPSGLAADAVMALRVNDTGGFLWRAGLLLAVCAATVVLAGTLVQRISTGDLVLDRVSQHTKKDAAPRPRTSATPKRRGGPAWMPPATAAMYQKEMRTLARDPQAKVELLQRMGALLIWPVILFSNGHSGSEVTELRRHAEWLFLVPAGTFVFSLLVTASNVLARDRSGLSLLFTMPAPRASFFHGKNAALLTVFTPLNLLTCGVIAVFTRQWALLTPAFLMTESMILLTLAEGNVFSVFTPYPLPEGRRNPYTSGAGCSFLGCAGTLAGFLAFLVLAVPVVAAFLVPVMWVGRAWLFLSAPLSAAYAAVIYWFITAWAARSLTAREPDVLAIILKTPA